MEDLLAARGALEKFVGEYPGKKWGGVKNAAQWISAATPVQVFSLCLQIVASSDVSCVELEVALKAAEDARFSGQAECAREAFAAEKDDAKLNLIPSLEARQPEHALVLSTLLGDNLPDQELVVALAALADQLEADQCDDTAAAIRGVATKMEVALADLSTVDCYFAGKRVSAILNEITIAQSSMKALMVSTSADPQTIMRRFVNEKQETNNSNASLSHAELELQTWVTETLRQNPHQTQQVATIRRLCLSALHNSHMQSVLRSLQKLRKTLLEAITAGVVACAVLQKYSMQQPAMERIVILLQAMQLNPGRLSHIGATIYVTKGIMAQMTEMGNPDAVSKLADLVALLQEAQGLTQPSEASQPTMEQAFRNADLNRDGMLSKEEFELAFGTAQKGNFSSPKPVLSSVIPQSNADLNINRNKFTVPYNKVDVTEQMFCAADRNSNGFLSKSVSKSEFDSAFDSRRQDVKAVPVTLSKDGITRLFEMGDTNGDGVLSRQEFQQLVLDTQANHVSRSSSTSPRGRSPEEAGVSMLMSEVPDEVAARQHIRVAIQMGQDVVQQLMEQKLYQEVQELRNMIEMLEMPLRGASGLSQQDLERIIEEAQTLVAKLLTYNQPRYPN